MIGKTGTAKVPVNKRYVPGVYRGSFAGVYPGEAPEVVVYVMIDRPSGMAFYGGLVAAPVFSQVVQQTLNRLGVLPDIEVQSQIISTEPGEVESF